MQWSKDNTVAVGKIPSGLFIVTAGSASGVDGYLASWIQQISFSPLMLSVAIKPGRPCYDYIVKDGHFIVNIIGKKGASVLKNFWRGYDPQNNPFAALDHKIGQNGGVILNQAMGVLECRVREVQHPGDHDILFAEVLKCHMLETEDENLIHIRKSGLDY